MVTTQLGKKDFPSLVQVFVDWLDKNAVRVNPVIRGFILYSLSKEAEGKMKEEMRGVYRLLRAARLVSYEEEFYTLVIPGKERLEKLLEDFPDFPEDFLPESR